MNDLNLKVYYNERYNSIKIGALIPDGMRFAGMIVIMNHDGFTFFSKDHFAEEHWIELGEL